MKFDPKTRLEQACDTEATIRMKNDESPFRPDTVIAHTFRDPTYGSNSLNAQGAVFRSKGKWYHLAYKGRTDAHNVDVQKLAYTIGSKIDRAKWDKYYLYDQHKHPSAVQNLTLSVHYPGNRVTNSPYCHEYSAIVEGR